MLKAKLTPESSTDIIRFYSSDKNVATVGATSGKLKAVREGKTTIMVYAKATKATSNSSKSNRIAKVNVYVGPHMYKVSQISTTEVKVFFKKDVEKYKLRASDFSIINNVTKASCSIKEISVNGNKVNLTTYNEIKDDNEYTVSCKNTSARFVATDGRVSSITIDTTEIEAKKETPLDLTLKDASGILLKKCSTDNMPAEMELTGTVDNGYISGGKVCITKPGSTAKVKVIYHTYKYKNGSEVGVIDTGYVIIRAYKNPNETVSPSPSVTPSPSPSLTPSPTPTPTQTPTPIYYPTPGYTWTPAPSQAPEPTKEAPTTSEAPAVTSEVPTVSEAPAATSAKPAESKAPTTSEAPAATSPAPVTSEAPAATSPAPVTSEAPVATSPAPVTSEAPAATSPAPATSEAPTTSEAPAATSSTTPSTGGAITITSAPAPSPSI